MTFKHLRSSSVWPRGKWPEAWGYHLESGFLLSGLTWMMWWASCRKLHEQQGSSSWWWACPDELTGRARMKKGVRSDRTVFIAGGEKIPLLAEQPIWSLGREYTSDLFHKQMERVVQTQLTHGLTRTDSSNSLGNSNCCATNSHCSSVWRSHWGRPGLAG